MSKDFGRILEDQKSYSDYQNPIVSLDPNIFVNEAAREEIKNKHNLIHLQSMMSQALISIVTAPLVTVQVSLQLSVKEHKDKYGDVRQSEKSKELINIEKEITVQDRRKFELQIKSGVTGTNKAFRAPVYSSYGECIRGLLNQGFLGFYKGNMVGIGHACMTSYFKFHTFDMLDFEDYKFHHKVGILPKMIIATGISSIIDIFLHPIMTVQSRLILQNRLENFFVYKNMISFFKKYYKKPNQMFQGWRAHIPKNIFQAIFMINVFNNPDKKFEGFVFSQMLAYTITYPFTTVLRRLQCQSDTPGMLPLRYGGATHTLKLIFTEEGIKGLFRGYFAGSMANIISLQFLLLMNSVAEYRYDMKYEV